jgi:membrane protein DedA with SNARE-associated domain
LLARYGRFLHLNERRVATMEGWFRRHGALAIVVGRLIPGLRTPTTVMAGLFGVPYRTFAPATAVAALLWAAAYYLLGALLHRHWQELVNGLVGDVDLPVAIAIGLVLAASIAGMVRWRGARAAPRR